MMSEQGGIGTTIAPETTPRVEQLMMGEAHCGLPKNQPHSPDVVAAFGKSSQPDSLKLNYITESSSTPPYTHDQIKEVEKNVQKLIDEGKCSGVYLNCLGKNGQSVESAKATIVFLEKLVELIENKDDDIAEAISEAKKTINFANIEGFSAVVVGNDGTVQVISEGESAVRVVRGGKVELIGDKLQKDDQLVLCAKSEVEGQDGGRLSDIIKTKTGTKNIIDALIEPPVNGKEKVTGQAHGAAAGKAEVVEVAAQAKIDLPVVKVGNSASAGVAMESTVKPAPESPLPVPVPSRDKATVEAVGSKVRIPPYYKDDGEALSYDKARAKLRVKESQLVGKQLESVNVDYMDKATDLIAEAQLLNPGVTITQIMDRLQNPGNYLTKTDAIFTLTGKYTGKYLKHELLILALELKQADGQRA